MDAKIRSYYKFIKNKYGFNNDLKYNIDGKLLYGYDKQNNLVLRANFQYIGIFNIETSVWVWSWNIPFIGKSMTKLARNVKKYIKKNLQKKLHGLEKELYNFYISYNNFYVNQEDINRIIMLNIYVNKNKWFATFKQKKYIYYLFIDRIIQY